MKEDQLSQGFTWAWAWVGRDPSFTSLPFVLNCVTPSDPGRDCELTQFEVPHTLYHHVAQTP